jgi:predicted ATPase
MITNLHINNFKSFGKPISANLSDLTIIAGANSGGKSTLIQIILLLAQTLENPRADVALDLGGRFVQFAEFREAVFGRPKNIKAEFSVGFESIIEENDLRDPRSLLMSKTQQSQLPSEHSIKLTKNHYYVEFGFSTNPAGFPQINFCVYKKTINGIGVFSFELHKQRRNYLATYQFQPTKKSKTQDKQIESIKQKLASFSPADGKSIQGLKYIREQLMQFLNDFPRLQISDLSTYKLRANLGRVEKAHSLFFNEIINDIQNLILQKSFSVSQLLQAHFDHFLFTANPTLQMDADTRLVYEGFYEHFRVANSEIKRFLRRIQYIGPLRAKPERAYLSAGTPIEIGNAGENAVPILWVNQNEKVLSKTKIGDLQKETTLANAVQEWLREFGIANEFHITKPKRVIYQAELESNPGSNVIVTIADVGFGVSQLLPVIVAGLWAQSGSTLILEQPEIHLHPRLQGKLADFFLCMVELGKNIIIETHSEHLINVLRLRIAQDKSNEIKKRIGILFVRPPLQTKRYTQFQSSIIENLKVDEYGKVINWPVDFFPEAGDLNENILKARFEKLEMGREK